MIGASLYISWCSAKNRLLVRLRRLREPRYLLGLVAGVAYFYFVIFARGRRPAVRAGRNPQDFGPAFQAMGTPLAGLFVLLSSVMPWVLPVKPQLLEFSEAEKDLLFAAPVTRRQLLVHRVIRSQVSSLVASFLIALFAAPLSGTGRLRLAVSFLILIPTVNIYFAAVRLTRARLRSPVASVRAGAWVPIALYVAVFGIVGISVGRELMQPAAGAADVFVRISRATSTGLPQIVLWPFTALIRAAFSPATGFLQAVASNFVVLALVTAWMLQNDVMFDEVAGQGGGTTAADERKTATRPASTASVVWTLPLTGRPELALVWKGATETFRGVSVKTWRYLVPACVGVAGMTFGIMQANSLRGPASGVAVVAAMIAGVAALLGPQIARGDLRTDFVHLELLKTWPMRAADVIRGEMAWPSLVVSAVLWAGLFVSAVFSGMALPNVPFLTRWSFAIAAMIAGPALIAAQFTVHNATAIVFPGWVQIGNQRTRGIDAMGQRLIMLAAIILSLAIFAIPGAIGGGVVWLILNRFIGNAVFIPAAMVFSVIVLVEVLAMTELLGPAYERLDVTSIERPE